MKRSSYQIKPVSFAAALIVVSFMKSDMPANAARPAVR
jgi:hypothetical protein